MIVDCHQHFWDLEKVEYPWLVPEYGPIFRTFKPEELVPQLAAAGIDRTVLVQSANSYEDTDSMLAQAAQHEWIGAVVGWVPVNDATEAARKLDDEYMANPWFTGVRHLNQEEADPDFLLRPAVIDGYRVLAERSLPADVVAIFPKHLNTIPGLAAAVPDLTIVIDHLAKPPIASGDYTVWKEQMRAAADAPNVHGKVSGLNTAADFETWTGDDLVESIGFAIEVFGTDRLMFGSDWPVAILAGDYAKVWAETGKALDSLGMSDNDRAKILGDNGAALYRVDNGA
jgi:L-fuconolactonase